MTETEIRDAAKAFEEEILQTVEITLKMPKPLFEFLKAVKEFTKTEETVEEICCQQIVASTIDLLNSNSIDEIFSSFKGRELIKAYKLNKVDC